MSTPFDPSSRTTPLPFGVRVIFPLDTLTISCPFTSRLPPSCGVVSSTIFERLPPPAFASTYALTDC